MAAPPNRGRPRKASTAGTGGPPSVEPSASTTPVSGTAGPSAATHPPPHSGIAPTNATQLTTTGPTTVAECEALAAQLIDSNSPMRRRMEIASELRDSAESNRDFAFYDKYLAVFVPALVQILGEEKNIVFAKDNSEQRFRHTLLAYLQRLPHSEPFRHHEAKVLELMVKLLKVENEDNALLCIKIMIDGFRSHKDQAEPFVEPFLDLVKQMYANLKGVVEKEFGSAGGKQGSANPGTPASDGTNQPAPPHPPTSSHTHLSHALHSPKVLTECPIAVVLIFQTYKSVMGPAMLDLSPLVMESIKIQPEPQRVAHLEAKERGEIFVGVAPNITNREMYTELIKTQVKTMAFLAYVLRGSSQANVKDYLEVFPEACIRLLRDCPPEDVSTRKELLVATRHILTADSRSSFIPYIDTLLEERVLVGTGVSSREALRPLASSVVADLIHHVRNELPIAQLKRVVYVFSCNLNDSTFSSSIQTMCAKLLNTIVDSIASKGDPEQSAALMKSMFIASLEKLQAMTEAYDKLKALSDREKAKGKGKAKAITDKADGEAKEDGDKDKDTKDDDGAKDDARPSPQEDVDMADPSEDTEADRMAFGWREIEQTMPVNQVAYADDSLDTFCREARYLFKTLLHTFRTLMSYTRNGENPVPPPDGELLSRFFEYSIRCIAIFDTTSRDPREPKEAIELLSQILLLFDPHSFREVWATHMDFFVEQALTNGHVFSVLQILITHESVSQQLVAITLKHLMTHLDEVGGYSPKKAQLCLRLFKISFLAINTYINTNEVVLVPHLQKLIMRSFALAPKADDPTVYYQILRALFRSIGGGRFDQLYKEVLPILQEMLDNLSYLLQHAKDPVQRDLFVELTLTVPVRLTNLLPHLSYLMKPLVHALQAGSELISQGLRTLELCIDNLTADFLDPTMNPVFRELMGALHKLLKPIPANRQHSHAAVKILGKLGGRNRRFSDVENLLEYRENADDLTAPISFERKRSKFQLAPVVDAAEQALDENLAVCQDDGLEALMLAAMTQLHKEKQATDPSPVFRKTVSALFHACHHPTLGEKATSFVRDFCRRVFLGELKRTEDSQEKLLPDIASRHRPLPLTMALTDAIVGTMASSIGKQRDQVADVLAQVIADFKELAVQPEMIAQNATSRNIDRFVYSFVRRFTNLCQDEDWNHKMAGVTAMDVFVRRAELSRKYIIELEFEFVRVLMFALRDAPRDPPNSVQGIIDLIKYLIQTCQSQDDGKGTKLARLTEILVRELNSQSKLAREASQDCIKLLAEVIEQPISTVIGDFTRQVLLDTNTGPIFSKPLRALSSFAMQVGNIDCVTYLLDLRPSVPKINDEFVRLVQEVLALADVEDASLIPNKRGEAPSHKQSFWLKELRIACLRMLRSTMNCQEFSEKQNLTPIRQRIIAVYFKHVYSPSPEIVDVAHEGLRDVIGQQSKLPKEVLQSGLRPILVNLADAKRLSVSGLEGLARFLELLTNYFKVEIGVKLLDHFTTLADQQMLQKAAGGPLEDNPDISRMTRLVNIFRLLPATAVQYLKQLTTQVVDVEAQLHQSASGPFTENIARYLDRYHAEGATNLLENIRNPRMVWTYRNIIQSGFAPQLVNELSERANAICQLTFADPEQFDLVLPGLHIIRELSKTSPSWLSDHETVLEALVTVWRSIVLRSRDPKQDMSNVHYQTIPPLILEMFMTALSNRSHVPLLFHVVEAYEIRSSFDRSHVAFFLYQRVALQQSVDYRREVIDHFMQLYADDAVVTWAFKTNALRLVVNPTLRVYFDDKENDGSLITPALVGLIADRMWRPLSATPNAKQREDTLLIEIFALTTLLVKHAGAKVVETRKEVFKLAWMGINLLEPTVKLMAYVLTASFMATYETPVKFVRLTWTGLLRLKDNESKALFRQAIDTLAGCLPIRDPPQPGTIPDWAQKVKTVLVEEGHATGTLVVVCELLVNHPDLFYDYRDLYVPHIAMSLQKLGFVQAATAEMKKLTVDVIELIFRWERKRMAIKDEASREHSADAMDVDKDKDTPSPAKRQRLDRAGTAVSSVSGGGWATPAATRELITAHLLRIVASSTEPVSRAGLSRRALDLFKEILGPKGLQNVSVKLGFFNRTMSQEITENTLATVANSAEVIAAVAEVRDQAWIRGKLEVLRKLLEKVWVYDDPTLHEVVRPLTERMFAELPDEEVADSEEEGQGLLKFVSTTVNNGLQASLRSTTELPGTIFLLKCWLKVQPKQLHNETLASVLLRVLSNLVKVHTSTNGPDPSYRLIISILDMLRDRVADLKEHRRYLVNILGALIDKSTNLTLCRYLLDLVRQWVVKDVDGPIVVKDKSLLLLRMASFEHRDDALFKQYLDLIYEVYELPELAGTDITHRLEPAFLLGTRSKDPAQRAKFLDKLEQTLPRSLDARLEYLYSLQNWETLADSYWIPQMLSLLLGAADLDENVFREPLAPIGDNHVLVSTNWRYGGVIQQLRSLVHVDQVLCHRLFVGIFPKVWSALSRTQQTSFTPYVSKLLCKEYHHKQADLHPNVIQTHLEAFVYCKPPITMPPLLVKYLAKTFNAWYAGFEILNNLADTYKGTDNLRESCATALGELYAELHEDDMFYGNARCRYVYPETSAALILEQNGRWPAAMEMYEATMTKARHSALPFSEDEFCLWEDHWILAAQKLQNWEALTELARADQNPDLLLECAWRLSDWGSNDREMIESNLKLVAGVPTPRRKIFEAFTALIKAHGSREPPNDFLRIVDEAQQVAIRKWTTLPSAITGAHLPLLQLFQQVVELGEAAQVFDSLQMTTAQTLEARVNTELKGIFQTWRDRLPNFWDDISVWSDLLAWRQHVFQAVTRVYMPMITPTEGVTHGYRGYHETAWMINRFGEVARRHGLLDVCSTALNKIYMLPNIEISEAFLKLREQALCYFQKPEKFNEGLDNISTTNLMYFAQPQKAEFLTLKGMFISRLGQDSDANDEFAHAVQMDYNLPKAWAEWGKFNEKMYRQQPESPPPGSKPAPGPGEKQMTDQEWAESWAQDRALRASSAVSCYLQAAGLYNSHKSRALLLRVLWLLGLDDSRNTIAKAFDNYKGDLVIWYWITLIPQLLLSLSHREGQIARLLLMHIAKNFPQALFYNLRVTRDDFSSVKKSQAMAAHRAAMAKREAAAKAAAAAGSEAKKEESSDGKATPEVKEEDKKDGEGSTSTPGGNSTPNPANGSMAPPAAPAPKAPRQPWEMVEEIINHLKTGVPLLALSMEKMVDQIGYRAKPTSEEDIYRFFSALLNDAMAQWSTRGAFLSEAQELGPNTKDNLRRFAANLHSDLRASVERDFITNQPKMRDYIDKLQEWRDFYERAIDLRPRFQPLDSSGINLTDFHYTKFEDVEVPGQYVQHIDQADELIRIARFHPRAELCRGFGFCFRRITMVGHNGTDYTFNVQMPAARHCRREERLVQLFRIMNCVLRKRKESRRRNLQFHLPTAVALGTQLRLIQNDSSYVSMQEIYDDYAFSHRMTHEDTILQFCDRQRRVHQETGIPRTDHRFVNLKMEIIEEIQAKMLPETVLTNYMIRNMSDSASLWLMRKQFALQTAATAFLTYVCCLNNRAPSRFHISRRTGQMYMTEMLPSFVQGQPLFHSSEAVPFRLTPNMQHFITRVGVEGIVSAAATAIAHSLTLPEFDLASTLHLFIRDEILTWQNTYNKGGDKHSDVPLTAHVYKNVDQFIKRAELMGHIGDPPKEGKNAAGGGPAINHAMVTLINQATSPALLASMAEQFAAWM